MLKLKLEILNGGRSGTKITLKQNSSKETSPVPYITENESIRFELRVSQRIIGATIILYDNRMNYSEVISNPESSRHSFFWKPAEVQTGYSYDTIFNNFFGIAELQVELEFDDGVVSLVEFSPLEVLASKMSSDRVEAMLSFLSKQEENEIYSAFHATKSKAGFQKGNYEPDIALEKIEKVTQFLEERIPLLCHSPITRLTTKKIVTQYNETLYPDESSIAWLSENLSVLIPTQEPEKAVLEHDNTYYTADILEVPVTQESSDLYENHVVHGFLAFILQEAQHIHNSLESRGVTYNRSHNSVNGEYKSFFKLISDYSESLIKPKKDRCKTLLRKLEFLRSLLNKRIPVREVNRNRPHITPKVCVNKHYLDLFHQAISWHEYHRPDWDAHENLFGIQNMPKLFETYCFFRVLHDLKISLSHQSGFNFLDNSGNEIELLNEPEFWVAGNRNSENANILNTEGWIVSKNNQKVSERKASGSTPKRTPDIVIKVTTLDGLTKILVLDAKYSTEVKSFTECLPQLTMKYIHGLHLKDSGNVTTSLTILCPSESGLIRSYHSQEYAYDGTTPVTPALQVVGLTPSEDKEDKLFNAITKLLEHSGVALLDKSL